MIVMRTFVGVLFSCEVDVCPSDYGDCFGDLRALGDSFPIPHMPSAN